MAGRTQTLSYKIVIDGQQARDEAKKMEGQMAEATAKVEEYKKQLEQARAAGAEASVISGLEKSLADEQKNLKTLNKLWKDRVVQIDGYDKQMKNLSKLEYNQLTRLQTSLNRALKKLSPTEDLKDYERLLEYVRQVNEELKGRKADFTNYEESRKKMNEMAKAMQNVSALTDKQLVEQKKYWVEVSKGLDENSRQYKRYQQFIKEAADEEQRRVKAQAGKVMTNLTDYSVDEIKEAIKATEQLRDAQKPGTAAWQQYATQVENANKFLKSFENQSKSEVMTAQFTKLKSLSVGALQEQEKYWKSVFENANRGTKAYIEAEKRLQDIQGERARRQTFDAEQVINKANFGDLGGSIAEMQNRLKLLQDYRNTIDSTKPDAYVRVDAAIEKLTQGIKESQAGFLGYADAMKQAEGLADGSFKGSISDLDKMKKTLEEYKGTLRMDDTAGLEKVNGLLGNIEQKQKELQSGYMSYTQAMIAASQVMNGSFDGSIADLEKLQKALTEYRNTLDIKDVDGLKDVDIRLEAITSKMQELKPGFMSFQDALAKAGQVSAGTFDGTLEDLDKIQKVLKEGMESELSLFNPNDVKQMKEAQNAMDEIIKKRKEIAQLRLSEQAETTMTDVENDNWDKTIRDTQEAIKQLQEYRNTLNIDDTDGLKRVDDVIEKLTEKTKQAEKGFMSLQEALEQAGKVQHGTFKGTAEELQKLKKHLEELRKTKVEIGGTDKEKEAAVKKLKQIDDALFVVESQLKDTSQEAVTLDDVLKDLGKANFNQLEMAAKALKEELKNMSEEANGYADKAAKLREVEAQMKKLKKQWESHDNVIMKTAKRLMAYVAVYGGFNEILSMMKELVGLNLQLSDSMADVQKTTGLAGVELQELGREIERIDSRTSTDKLYEIAAAAGQIGLKTQQDVLGFTKAANTITVALNELGTEGAANLMKIATLTGEVASYGTEDALMRVGSAINELTANSAATAGPITDFIGRVGGIASASKIAISEMAALGAVTDASAQSVEIAGTSMNKFISALMSNTENIAYAANISVKDLQELINSGQTMEAVIRVLESMQTMSRGAQSALLKELGSEGARMNQYVAALVSNLDMLKEQLAISRRAFEENVSVINEYNVKQESAAGILERMKNSFKDAFVNSRAAVGMVNVLENISKLTSKIVDLLSNSPLADVAVGIITFTTKLLAWVAEFTPALIALEAVVVRLMVLNIHNWLFGIGGALSNVVKIIKTSVVAAFVGLRNTLAAIQISFITASAGATGLSAVLAGLRGVITGLWATIAANPLGVIATVAGVVISLFHNMRDESDELAEAMAELNKKHIRERQELQALRDAMESTNTSYAVKASALEKLNSLYSKYLGFQLSEIDSYEKKAAALDLINVKLKEQQALEEKNRRKEYVGDQFADATKDDLRNLEKIFTDIPEIGRSRWHEAMDQIQLATQEGVTNSLELAQRLADYFNISVEKLRVDGSKEEFRTAIMDYAREYSIYLENTESIEAAHSKRLVSLKKEEYEQTKALAEAHQNDIAAMELAHQKKVQDAEKEGRKISEQEQIAHLQALKRENEQYLETAKKMQEYWVQADAEKLKDPMVANSDGSVIPSMVGALYGRAASVEAKEYNELLKERNNIEEEYLGMAAKIKAAEEELAKVEAQRKESWDTPEEEDAYLKALGVAQENVEREKKERDRLYKEFKAADRLMNDQFKELSLKAASSARKEWTNTIEEVKSEIDALAILIAGDPYGKKFNVKSWKDFGEVIENLKSSSPEALAAAYKKLRDESMTITADVEAFNKMFDPKTPKKNLDELNVQVLDWANQLRQELASRGRGITGEFLFGEGKEGYDQVLDQLQTHFIKQQKQLRESYLKGLMTGPELKRRLDANNKEFLNVRVELNKLMLGQANSFDQTLYPELAKANLAKIARTIFTAGEEVRAEIEQSLAEDENTILEGAIKIRENLEKEFTKTSPFRTLDNQFKDTLDNLGLMSSEFEREIVESLSVGATEINKFGNMIKHWDPLEVMGLDKENMEKRFEIIKEFADKSYTVDAEGLRDMMREHQDYDNWIRPMKTEQLEYLLQASRWYYDQELLAVKSYTSQLKKEYDSMYNQLQLKMSDSGRAQWEIEQLSGQLLAPDLEEGKRKAIIARINELEKERDEARQKESDKAKSHRAKQEREAKEQMEASISDLKAYYNEMEAWIRQQGLKEGLTPADIERKVLANKVAAERDEIELRKKLLGEASNFDPNANNGYRGVITGTEFFGSNKGEKELKKQAEQIQTWGKALIGGMRNEIAKGEVEIATDLQKAKDKIRKALLEGDMFGKFESDFGDMLDELGVLTSDFEDTLDAWHLSVKEKTGIDFGISLSEEERAKRIKELTKFADQAYQLNAESLRERMMQNTMYSNWVENLSDDEMNVLLQKLRNYYSDRLELTKKYQDQMKKEFEAMYQQTGQQAEYEQRKNDAQMRSQRQSDLEGFGGGTDYGAKRQGVADNWEIENQRLEDEIADYQEKKDALTKDLAETMRSKGMGSEEYQELYQQYLATSQLITDTEIKQNELLAQSQRDLTQVYMDEWTKRAEKWGQVGEMFGDFLGKQMMLEKQANEARARGDLETAKEIEKQQKKNKETLIQNLLNFVVDEAAILAKEYAMKMMFNALSLSEDKKKAIEEMTLKGKKSTLSIFLSALTGQAEEHKKGLPGLITGAIIFAATMALQAMAKSAIANMFPEAASETNKASGGRLATGMLTYADGNYPVLGNDGNVYNAKYEGGEIKTGIYRGGAHFGIFSEKKPEAIIDGDTTQRLIMNHPDIWKAIVTLSKTGRLDGGMRTFAAGNINDLARQAQDIEATAAVDSSVQMMEMQATIDRNSQIMAQLTQVLAGGITARMDMYGENGAFKQLKKAEKFANRVGYK